jgi:hypothetical protein
VCAHGNSPGRSDERTYHQTPCTPSLYPDRTGQFCEPVPLAAIHVELGECAASTDSEPLPDKLRFAVDGAGDVAAGDEAWFAGLREGAAALLRAGAAAVPVFVGDLACGSAF